MVLDQSPLWVAVLHIVRSIHWPLRRKSLAPFLLLLITSILSENGRSLFASSFLLKVTVLCSRSKILQVPRCPTNLASSRVDQKQGKERAGADGYSVLRQPVKWESADADTKVDKRKKVPQTSQQPSWLNSENTVLRDLYYAGSAQQQQRSNENELDVTLATKKLENEEATTIQHVNLYQRTRDTLDYPRILKALRKLCTTVPAQQLVTDELFRPEETRNESSQTNHVRAMRLSATSVIGVHARYQAVREMQLLKESHVLQTRIKPIPLSSKLDLQSILSPLDKKSDKKSVKEYLDGDDIMELASILNELHEISEWCATLNKRAAISEKKEKAQKRSGQPRFSKTSDDYMRISTETVGSNQSGSVDNAETETPQFIELPKLGQHILISEELRDTLNSALDEDGQLDGTTFPSIGRLRLKIQTLQSSILSTVKSLLNSPSISSKLATESGGSMISEVNGRIVIPIDASQYSKGGKSMVVHDVSRSGKTYYCEPPEVVSSTNELREAEVALEAEIVRIWKMLTEQILECRDDLEESVAAAAHLDLVQARLRFGELMTDISENSIENRPSVIIPEVQDEGVIKMEDARHPVLLLRQISKVVGNDIELGVGQNQGLILTGPNSGGKTIMLKILGLCALMVRDGIPIPAKTARVDFFDPVLADIGDMQSVGGDLSTFSGHMLVCREVLASSQRNALVLMDELGSGTDPAQGVAIAQSLLEALVDKGARVAITTHYMELKQLASSDARFTVGGMQFLNGRPTYRLLAGTVGESFALAVAERLELPQTVISRANELLGQETRQMGDLIRDLEDQKELVDRQVEELAQKQREMDQMKEEMERAQKRLEKLQLNARREEAKKFAAKLEEKEKVLEDILEKLRSDPSKRVIANSWNDVKYVKRDVLQEAEFLPGQKRQLPSDSMQLVPITQLDDMPDLQEGDNIVVCKEGAVNGKEATITKVTKKNVEVSVGGMPLRLKWDEIALPSSALATQLEQASRAAAERRGKKVSKFARQALAEAQQMESISSGPTKGESGTDESNAKSQIRTSSNTLDLRGKNLAESEVECQNFFSQASMQNRNVVFILHGHGTGGVLKTKLRDWLRRERQWVKRFQPADPSDGGDAFTMVELKKLKI